MQFVWMVWEYTEDGPEFVQVHRNEAKADAEALRLDGQYQRRKERMVAYGFPPPRPGRFGVQREVLR